MASPRRTAARVWVITSGSTAKVAAGSKPSTVFRPATSSAPSFEPCEPWVSCLVGDGHAMIVRSRMKDGLSVTALAASIAAYRASTSSV